MLLSILFCFLSPPQFFCYFPSSYTYVTFHLFHFYCSFPFSSVFLLLSNFLSFLKYFFVIFYIPEYSSFSPLFFVSLCTLDSLFLSDYFQFYSYEHNTSVENVTLRVCKLYVFILKTSYSNILPNISLKNNVFQKIDVHWRTEHDESDHIVVKYYQ